MTILSGYFKKQRHVDLSSGEEVTTTYERSDFCPVPRAVPILEAMISFVIADELLGKLGGDSLEEMKPRFEGLKRMRLTDLPVDKHGHTFWTAEE